MRPLRHQLAHPHAHHHRRMPRRHRLMVYAVSGVLWLSGLVWLVLDQFFARQQQFGRTPHPLESPVLLIHGVVAILAMYALGWISARHVLRWWMEDQRRLSGGVFTAVLFVLTLSGFALFFLSDDESQRIARILHEVLGVGITLLAAQHWFFRRRSASALEPGAHLGSHHSHTS
jgi:hypothetical protein